MVYMKFYLNEKLYSELNIALTPTQLFLLTYSTIPNNSTLLLLFFWKKFQPIRTYLCLYVYLFLKILPSYKQISRDFY